MELFEAIHGRRSVRAFKPDPVKDGDLEKILEAGIAAPSAGNCQPWEFVVVRDKKVKQKLSEAAFGQSSVAQAPVVIVVCANVPRVAKRYGSRGAELYSLQDTAAATQNMHLAAYALGYGTCWVGAFEDGAAAKAINVPSDVRPVAMIPIGKPAETPKPTSRMPLDKVLHEDGF
jgi:nitroreductase